MLPNGHARRKCEAGPWLLAVKAAPGRSISIESLESVAKMGTGDLHGSGVFTVGDGLKSRRGISVDYVPAAPEWQPQMGHRFNALCEGRHSRSGRRRPAASYGPRQIFARMTF
jgi:hypothetical protein